MKHKRRIGMADAIRPHNKKLHDDMAGEGILDSIRNLFKRARSTGQKVVGNLEAAYDSNLGTAIRNAIPDSDETARPGYPGERHAILRLPNGKFGSANYMGPGTNLIQRLRNGDPGRTPVDAVSKGHDIRYGLAKDIGDIRKADNIMLGAVKRISQGGLDDRLNTNQANLIKLKKYGENFGMIKRDAFSGDLSLNENIPIDEQDLMRSELGKLELKGYGKPADRLIKKVLRQVKPKQQRGKGVKHILKALKMDKIVPFTKIKEVLGSSPTGKRVLNMLLQLHQKHMGGSGVSKTNKKMLYHTLERDMNGSGFGDFVKLFKKVMKVGGPLLSLVAPEVGAPLTVLANL